MEVYNSIGTPDHLTALAGIQAIGAANFGLPNTPVDGTLNYVADNNGHFSNNEVNNSTLTVDWQLEAFR